LLVLLGASVWAGKGLNPSARGAGLVVKVVARQWWWEFQYQASPPSQMVTTANELHIPVGTAVLLQLTSRDVIHSFWVPSLHGKRDLIPGHDSTTYIQADQAGLYRGQCAEFCGDQHARMGLLVVAEPPDAFARWLEHQRKPAAEATSPLAARGQVLVTGGLCATCHTVLGTPAAATIGPDLTHVAGRQTVGAGSLANTHDHLSRWILDSQNIKPGNRMPPVPLSTDDLQAVVAYLETLK
jgi:cytochrome c oxidase subunit 2